METMSVADFKIRQITFDCHDPSKLAEFWSAATVCEIAADYGDFVMVDSTPALGFQRVEASHSWEEPHAYRRRRG